MPRLIETNSRIEAILAAATLVLAEHGLERLTLRAIATEARISPASLIHHFETRERLVHLMAQLAGRAWLASLSDRTSGHGVLGLLPVTEDEVDDARVWLSWCELARSGSVKGTVGDVLGDERAILDRVTDRRLTADSLDLTLAVVRGLREAVCAAVDPMPLDHARQLLRAHLGSAPARPDQPAADSAFARSSATIRSGSAAE